VGKFGDLSWMSLVTANLSHELRVTYGNRTRYKLRRVFMRVYAYTDGLTADSTNHGIAVLVFALDISSIPAKPAAGILGSPRSCITGSK
jgi:hypothetical protein